jgi:hypothetical protein
LCWGRCVTRMLANVAEKNSFMYCCQRVLWREQQLTENLRFNSLTKSLLELFSYTSYMNVLCCTSLNPSFLCYQIKVQSMHIVKDKMLEIPETCHNISLEYNREIK